jgi:nicotinate-nucleotide adenylyltransferase
MKIGIFGGTFNPIHYGISGLLRRSGQCLVWTGYFYTFRQPPLKRKIWQRPTTGITWSGRLSEAIHFEVLDIECIRPGKSYTVNTLELLVKKYADVDLLHARHDAFDIPNWREPEKILSLTNFIVLSRPGYDFEDLLGSPYLDIKTDWPVWPEVERIMQDCPAKQQKSVPLKVTPIGFLQQTSESLLKKDSA